MSDYKAIATITAVIRDIILNNQNIETAIVKTLSPAKLKVPSNDTDILNLFLYQVTSNAACRNLDLPTRNQNGQMVAKPTLALDLHYLLTALSDDEIKAQLILSSAMVALHENAIISKNKIAETILDSKMNEGTSLIDSNVTNQVESLKISLEPISIEELTKLWSSFFQTSYCLSVAYTVSVVLLECPVEITPSLPVSKSQLRFVPLKQPIIEKIEPQIMTYDPTKKLVINGRNLGSDKVFVRLNGEEIEVKDRKDLSENQIRLLIPENTLAGVKQVQVLQKLLFNKNDVEGHKGHTSNVAAFVLAPNLKSVTQTGGELTLSFEPGIAENQKVNVLIGDYVINADLTTKNPKDYPLKNLTVTIPPRILDLLEGTYPVRLRVDNADSSLNNDNNSINISK